MVTFNYARFRKDESGTIILDLELQLVLPNQRILFHYSFPATANIEVSKLISILNDQQTPSKKK